MPMSSYANLPTMNILNRIYVGSIQFDISEQDVASIFSVYGPIRSVNMMVDAVNKRHKGYGFIEFETPEAAALAQAMDGADLAGRSIKVGRPQNFPSDLPPGVPRPVFNRIYVANVHELIQESELRAIFEAFGPVRHCNLVPDQATRKHKEYGYVEFEQINNAVSAIQALNGFELAGRPLKVGKTVIGGAIPAGMSSLAETAPRIPSAVLRAASQINAAIVGSETSTVLIQNLEDFDACSRDTGTLLKELEEDVGEECGNFGVVLSCQVRLDHVLRSVEAIVRFSQPAEAQQAIKVMDKRWFGGRQLAAISVPDPS